MKTNDRFWAHLRSSNRTRGKPDAPKGALWMRSLRKWRAVVPGPLGQRVRIGEYDAAEDAAAAVERWLRQHAQPIVPTEAIWHLDGHGERCFCALGGVVARAIGGEGAA